MAYLPPAGVRQLTAHKKSHLPTMSEIPNPAFLVKNKKQEKKTVLTGADFPHLKNKDADWPRPHYPRYPKFSPLCDDGCSGRCQCVKPELLLGENASHIGRNLGAKDPRELPYGLPPITYDCKRRADTFDYWKEDMAKFSGSFALWNKRFGRKYFYIK